ncbi:MAG: hypothetical protein AAF587_17460 [Bacteroidota bacterium]
MKTQVIFWGFWLIIYGSAYCQVELRLLNSPSTPVNLESMMNVEVHQISAVKIPVFFTIEILAKDGQHLYEGKSALFPIGTGTHTFRPGDIALLHSIQPENPLEGEYVLCISMLTQRNDQVLAQICQNQLFTSFSPSDDQVAASKKQQLVSFSGTMRLTAQLSNQYFPFQEVSPSYLRWEVSPTLTVKQIPLQARLFLSTEKNSFRYDLNTVSLNLDRQQLQNNLQQMASAKLREEARKRAAGLPFDASLLQQVENLKQLRREEIRQRMGHLPNLSEDEILQSVQQLHRIEEILDHPAFDKVDQSWQSWEKRIPTLSPESAKRVKDSLCLTDPEACKAFHQLMSQKEELDKLRSRKDSLMAIQVYEQSYREELHALKQLKTDQGFLQDPRNLQQLPILGKAQKWLSQLETLSIGTSFPQYSSFLMEGISVNGVDVAARPGKFFLAFTGGELGRSFLPLDTLFPQPSGRIFGSRMGVGRKQGNFLHVSLLNYQSDTVSALTPQVPWVYGIEGQVFLARKKWRLQGEWAQSAGTTTSDAWKVEAEGKMFEGKTSLHAHYQKVMPDYFSPGAPLLLTDQERAEFRLDQQLLKGKMILSGYYRKFQDVPFLYKLSQSTVQSAGGRILLNLPKLPTLQVDVAPFFQQNHTQDSLLSRNYQALLSAQIGHAYKLGSLTGNTRLMYSQQIGEGSVEGTEYRSSMFTFSQLLSIRNALNLQASATYLQADYSLDYNETLSVDASANVSLFRKWNMGMGATLLHEAGDNGLYRRGLYAYSMLPIWKQLSCDLRLERSQYKNFGPEQLNRNEYLFRFGLNYIW